MAQKITVEKHVIEVLDHTRRCDLGAVTRQCTNLTWNQVFLAVDRVSRTGRDRPNNDGVGLGHWLKETGI